MWNKLSMADKARYIKMGVANGITDMNTIRDTYNLYADDGRVNKYDGNSQSTQQMQRVNYYDPITGKSYGSVRPKGKIEVTSFNDLTPKAQDEYMANHPTTLDELVVTPEVQPRTMLGMYDDLSQLTDANLNHAMKVRSADENVHETAAFDRIQNLLSPGQYFGATIDAIQGERGFGEALWHGNSGWVSDNLAREHPYWSMLANTAGDWAIPAIPKAVKFGVNRGLSAMGYTKELPLNENNFYRVVGIDAIEDANVSGQIRARTGWYHGSLDWTLENYGEYLKDFTKEQLRRMRPDEVEELILERMEDSGVNLSRREKMKMHTQIRPSTNHGGTVGFVKGDLFYEPLPKEAVIEGTPKSAEYASGHHGKVNYEVPIDKGNPVVMLDEATGLNTNASVTLNDGFRYYTQEPLLDLPGFKNKIYWKRHKFKHNK